MEYVDTSIRDDPGRGFPWWVRLIDKYQVGLTRDGRLVAYDYANLWPQEPTIWYDGLRYFLLKEDSTKGPLADTLRLFPGVSLK